MEIEHNGNFVKVQHYDRLIKNKYIKVDVLEILSNPYPENIDDYAIHLLYKYQNGKFFTCSNKIIINNELVKLIVDDGDKYVVNIRTGHIFKELI